MVSLIWGMITAPGNLYAASAIASPSLGDYDVICSSTLAANNSTDTRLSYCQSALSSKQAASADAIVWKLWTATFSVCLAACVSSFVFTNLPYVCTTASIAADVGQGIATKNFMSALSAIGITLGTSAGVSVLSHLASSAKGALKKTTPLLEATTAGKKKNPDWAACTSTAAAGYQVYTHYQSQVSDQAAELSSLVSANSLTSTATVISGSAQSSSNLMAGNTQVSGNQSKPTLASSNTTVASNSASSVACNAASSGALGAMVACATASSATLPSFVTSPNFASQFQNLTGQNLGNYLHGDGASPATASAGLSAAANSVLGSSLANQLGDPLKGLEILARGGDTHSGYAQGAAQAANASTGTEPDVNQLVAGFLEKLQPTPTQTPRLDPVTEVDFAYKHQSAVQIAHNPQLSLFARVSFRYQILRSQLDQVPFAPLTRRLRR